MHKQLPRLRPDLDIIPSPITDKPGLIFRDPFRYTDEILIIPPLLARGLVFFDGQSTTLDVQAYLSKLIGEIVPGEIVETMAEVLQSNGFLESEEFEKMRAERHAEFAASPLRLPSHSGAAYPAEPEVLRGKLEEYINGDLTPADEPIIGLAAPHVSPEGGRQCYAAAYGRLSGAARRHAADKTIVLLGTSHYGAPEKFGMTRKSFVTPLGVLQPDLGLIDWILERAGESVILEDYCHSVEHSIEFQCIFLQQMLGSEFKILPILCGPFAKALTTGERPEKDDQVMRFFDALGEMAELNASTLFWILGVDLAHIGRRYHDPIVARANRDEMIEVEEEDLERLNYVCGGKGEEFFQMVSEERDPLKWCGFPPLYTFLASMPNARGKLLHYDQWNIDEQSVVSFAALEFKHKG
jgi:hypothetical protein